MTFRCSASGPITKGFTLIELLVVLSIVAVLVGFVSPYTFNSLEKMHARKELIQLESLIKSQQINTFYRGGQITMEFEATNAVVFLPDGTSKTTQFEYLSFPSQKLIFAAISAENSIALEVYDRDKLLYLEFML